MPQRVINIAHSRLPSSSNVASPRHKKIKKLASFRTLDSSMTPTMLLMHMQCPHFHLILPLSLHQFKSVMPPAVRTMLAGRKFENIGPYTKAADDVAKTSQDCTNVYMVGFPSKLDICELCFYHTCFGNKEQKYRAPCKFKMMGNELAHHQ